MEARSRRRTSASGRYLRARAGVVWPEGDCVFGVGSDDCRACYPFARDIDYQRSDIPSTPVPNAEPDTLPLCSTYRDLVSSIV